ncbi:Alpha/Beta hydrolase protein [Xylariales sp. PMI_506]|nr:Alpha/Beta hydrolase protein [Xylariales sp. PMI_506]
MSAISSTTLDTPSGKLELLCCLPDQQSVSPAILFVHGAFCSAHDYQFFLPYFAARGIPAYALSTRGHGQSWAPSTLRLHFLTTFDDYAADISAALYHIRSQHSASFPATPPIVAGHSFGGAHLQYLLNLRGKTLAQESQQQQKENQDVISGLVLLGSAPLSGKGGEIMANWEAIETKGQGYKYPWSKRSEMDTAEQVRDAFFHEATDATAIELWRTTCRSKVEGARPGLALMWAIGEAPHVLRALDGIGSEGRRKVLCVAGSRDGLVKPKMVADNVEAYRTAVVEGGGKTEDETIRHVLIQESAHHLMMDLSWEKCAQVIVDWMEDRSIPDSI